MCIICYKPAGIAVPREIIENCFDNNPDGAGYVWYDAAARKLVLKKALMTEAAAVAAMEKIPTEAPAVLHFRITTHGTDAKHQTHPFKLADDVRDCAPLNTVYSGYAVAHNGVFSGVTLGAEYSDTQAFIVKVLAPLQRLAAAAGRDIIADDVRPIIEAAIGTSKLTIMAPTGAVELYGSWEHDKQLGLYFSNTSYRYKRQPLYYNNYNYYNSNGWHTYPPATAPAAKKLTTKRVLYKWTGDGLEVRSMYNRNGKSWHIDNIANMQLYIDKLYRVYRAAPTASVIPEPWLVVADDCRAHIDFHKLAHVWADVACPPVDEEGDYDY